MGRILVADDEAHIRDVIQYTLQREGLEVEVAADGEAALERLRGGGVDLLILDVLMPELDGLATCRAIRATSLLPIIFLSSRAEEVDRITGLDLGGDDYVTKPFSPRELASRVKAVLRRARARVDEPGPVLRRDRIAIDLGAAELLVDGERIDVTLTELRMLAALLQHPGRCFTREQLIERAYEGDHHVSARTVDTHIRRLRGKLRPLALDPIETVHGLGYKGA